MNNLFSTLFSKVLNNIILWAKESIWRSFLILILVFIFLVPLVGYLQSLVRNFPYITTFNLFITFLKNNLSIKDYLFILIFLFILYLIKKQDKELLKTRVIKENFEKGLNGWNIPLGTGWTIQDCDDSLGKMLNVTHSPYPGVLKDTYSWYDYEISFQVKFDKSTSKEKRKFAVVVRSENNFNGIMLQFSENEFRPHLLYNGTYILDEIENLPTILKIDVWIPISLFVKGSNIDIYIYNYKIQYKIPMKAYTIDSKLLSSKETIKLSNIELKHNEIKDRIARWITLYNKGEATKDPIEKKKLSDESDSIFKNIPPTSRILFEYQKGSIGFRESDTESAYFKNLIVKKI